MITSSLAVISCIPHVWVVTCYTEKKHRAPPQFGILSWIFHHLIWRETAVTWVRSQFLNLLTIRGLTPENGLWCEAHVKVKLSTTPTGSSHFKMFKRNSSWQAQWILHAAKSEPKVKGFVARSKKTKAAMGCLQGICKYALCVASTVQETSPARMFGGLSWEGWRFEALAALASLLVNLPEMQNIAAFKNTVFGRFSTFSGT